MCKASFDLSERIVAPVERVYEHLSEPSSYLGLQPLLIEVLDTARGADNNGRPTRTFRSIERLRLLGMIPYRNSITTKMTLSRKNERIDFEVHSPGGVTLRSAFAFSSDDGCCLLRDQVMLECPALLRSFVVNEATKAHRTMLENIKHRLEGRS